MIAKRELHYLDDFEGDRYQDAYWFLQLEAEREVVTRRLYIDALETYVNWSDTDAVLDLEHRLEAAGFSDEAVRQCANQFNRFVEKYSVHRWIELTSQPFACGLNDCADIRFKTTMADGCHHVSYALVTTLPFQSGGQINLVANSIRRLKASNYYISEDSFKVLHFGDGVDVPSVGIAAQRKNSYASITAQIFSMDKS